MDWWVDRSIDCAPLQVCVGLVSVLLVLLPLAQLCVV